MSIFSATQARAADQAPLRPLLRRALLDVMANNAALRAAAVFRPRRFAQRRCRRVIIIFLDILATAITSIFLQFGAGGKEAVDGFHAFERNFVGKHLQRDRGVGGRPHRRHRVVRGPFALFTNDHLQLSQST